MELPELHEAAREIRESNGVRTAVVRDYGDESTCIEVVASIIPYTVKDMIEDGGVRLGNCYGSDTIHDESRDGHMTLRLVSRK